jgi:hypothetical protein
MSDVSSHFFALAGSANDRSRYRCFRTVLFGLAKVQRPYDREARFCRLGGGGRLVGMTERAQQCAERGALVLLRLEHV